MGGEREIGNERTKGKRKKEDGGRQGRKGEGREEGRKGRKGRRKEMKEGGRRKGR